jgi:uncharacterized protein GlcG (DUF336 family)
MEAPSATQLALTHHKRLHFVDNARLKPEQHQRRVTARHAQHGARQQAARRLDGAELAAVSAAAV